MTGRTRELTRFVLLLLFRPERFTKAAMGHHPRLPARQNFTGGIV